MKRHQVVNHATFAGKWKSALAGHRPNGVHPEIERDRWAARRVLVIDACMLTPDQDSGSVRTLAINMLDFLGYEVEVVESGAAAIEQFALARQQGHPFDVVMLDLIVPGAMGGREAIDQLAGIDPGVKAILVSGYAQDSVLAEYRDYGFQAIITKPFTLQELSTTLHSVMGSPAWRVH